MKVPYPSTDRSSGFTGAERHKMQTEALERFLASPVIRPEARSPQSVATDYVGMRNIYVCGKCRGHIVTVDLEAGVTPFSTTCKATPGCRGSMTSSFYRVADQNMRPSHVWYRPENTLGLTVMVNGHVSRGGLLLREVQEGDFEEADGSAGG